MASSARLWPLAPLCVALAAATVAAPREGVCAASGCLEATTPDDTNPEGYFWRRRGGGVERITSSRHAGPTNFSGGPAWVWPNELDEQVRHAPLIDAERNVYIATGVRIRKLDRDGNVRWTWEVGPSEGKMTACPALYGGVIYALAFRPPADARVYAVDMETGRQRWTVRVPKFVHSDAHSLLAHNGTVIFASRDHVERTPGRFGLQEDGNNQVNAVSATDGRLLWEYTLDDVVWNLMVSTPGDGTMLFSSQCGGVWRLDWAGGLVWRKGRAYPGQWCGCGGGTLGPNGLFYAEFNDWRRQLGTLAAHRVSDGSLVWERTWPFYYGGWQYPGVGRLAPSGRLAVVAPLGSITSEPRFPGVWWLDFDWVPFSWKSWFYHELYLKSPRVRRAMGVVPLPNAVAALDAETGKTLWWAEEEPWDRTAAAGDEELFVHRALRARGDDGSREDVICLPDPQGVPLIAGDGTVYAASSHSGDLAAIRDADGNGVIDAAEFSIFKTGIGFLNGPSLAPGMLVAAPCWGPVYVFKDASAA